MNWLLRKSVAIVAIYSITLQILLSGFVFAKQSAVNQLLLSAPPSTRAPKTLHSRNPQTTAMLVPSHAPALHLA